MIENDFLLEMVCSAKFVIVSSVRGGRLDIRKGKEWIAQSARERRG